MAEPFHCNSSTLPDGRPLNHTLVTINNWRKNTYEVIEQMTNDEVRTTNRVPLTSTLDTRTSKFGSFDIRNSAFDIFPVHQDCGNGYTKTLLCFMQIFIVSKRDRTCYFANNNARHFAYREPALAA